MVYQIQYSGSAVCNADKVLDPGQTATIYYHATTNTCSGTLNDQSGPLNLNNLKLKMFSFYASDGSATSGGVAGCKNWVPGPFTEVLDTSVPLTWGSGGASTSGTSVGSGGSMNGGTNAATMSDTNSIAYSTNNPIQWATNSGAADNRTLQQGFGALYDITSKGFAANAGGQAVLHNDLRDIVAGISGLGTNGSSGGGSTNGTSDAGTTNAINRFHTDNTNALAGIYGAVTNGLGRSTNFNGSLSTIGTNAAQAVAISDSTTASVRTGLGAVGTAISGGGPSGFGGGGGLDIAIGTSGYTMTIDPIHDTLWSQMWSMMKGFAYWLLCAAYMAKIGKDVFELVKMMGTAHGIQVPDLQGTFLGVGGNFGAVAFPVIVAAVMIVYGTLLAYVTSQIADTGPITSTIGSNPFSGATGAVAMGLNWLFDAFPVSEACALVVAYLTWLFSKNVVAISFITTMKAIMGS